MGRLLGPSNYFIFFASFLAAFLALGAFFAAAFFFAYMVFLLSSEIIGLG
jgi:hypothetical protein